MVSLKRALRRRRQLHSLLPRLKADDPDLIELRLVRDGVTDADVARLSSALSINTSVRLLDLSGNKITSRGARSLATALLSNESVEAVRLNGNPLGDEGVGSLCQALANRTCGVGTLYLRRVGMGRYGAQALGAALVGAEVVAPRQPRTPRRDNDANGGGDEAGTDLTSPMESLNSTIPSEQGDDPDPDAAAQLVEGSSSVTSGSLGSSVVLGAESTAAGSAVTESTVGSAATTRVMTNVTTSGGDAAGETPSTTSSGAGGGTPGGGSRNNDGAPPLPPRAQRPRAAGIVHLDLADNPSIGNRGANALASALRSRSCRLRRLNLAGAGVRDAGAAALGSALANNRTLRHLDLYGNHVGDAGAERMAEALWFNRTVRTLNLGWNRMGNEGKSALATALEGAGNNSVVVHLFVSTTNDFSDPRGVVDLSHEEVRAEVKRVEMVEEERKIRGRQSGDDGGSGRSERDSWRRPDASSASGSAAAVSSARARKSSSGAATARSPAGGRTKPPVGPSRKSSKSPTRTPTTDNRRSAAARRRGEPSPARRREDSAAAAASASSSVAAAGRTGKNSETVEEEVSVTDSSSSTAAAPKRKAVASSASITSPSPKVEKKTNNKKKPAKKASSGTKNKKRSYFKTSEEDQQQRHQSFGMERHPLDSDSDDGYDYDSAAQDEEGENDENANSRASNQRRYGPQHKVIGRDDLDKKPKPKPRGILRSPPLRSPPPLTTSSGASAIRSSNPAYGGHGGGAFSAGTNPNNGSSRKKKTTKKNGYVSDSSTSSSDSNSDDDDTAGTGGSGSLSGGTVDTADGTTIDYLSSRPTYPADTVPPPRFPRRNREPVGMSGSLLEDTTSESENGEENDDDGDDGSLGDDGRGGGKGIQQGDKRLEADEGEESETPAFFTTDEEDYDDDDDVWGGLGSKSGSGSWDAAAAVKEKVVWDASDLVGGDSYDSEEDDSASYSDDSSAPSSLSSDGRGGMKRGVAKKSGKIENGREDDGDDDDDDDEDPFGRCHPDDDGVVDGSGTRLDLSEYLENSSGSGRSRGGVSASTPRKSNVTSAVVRMLMDDDDDDDDFDDDSMGGCSVDDVDVDDNIFGVEKNGGGGSASDGEAFELPPIEGAVLPLGKKDDGGGGGGALSENDAGNESDDTFLRSLEREKAKLRRDALLLGAIKPSPSDTKRYHPDKSPPPAAAERNSSPWTYGESARRRPATAAGSFSPSPGRSKKIVAGSFSPSPGGLKSSSSSSLRSRRLPTPVGSVDFSSGKKGNKMNSTTSTTPSSSTGGGTTNGAGSSGSARKQLWDVRTVNRQISQIDTDQAGMRVATNWDSTKWGKGITPMGSDDGRGVGGNNAKASRYSFSSPPNFDTPRAFSSSAWDAGRDESGRMEESSPWGAVQRDWEQGDDADADAPNPDDDGIGPDAVVDYSYSQGGSRRGRASSSFALPPPPSLDDADADDGDGDDDPAADEKQRRNSAADDDSRLGIAKKDDSAQDDSTVTTVSSIEKKGNNKIDAESPVVSFSWSDLVSPVATGGAAGTRSKLGPARRPAPQAALDEEDENAKDGDNDIDGNGGHGSLSASKTGARPLRTLGLSQPSQGAGKSLDGSNEYGSLRSTSSTRSMSARSMDGNDDTASAALRWLEDGEGEVSPTASQEERARRGGPVRSFSTEDGSDDGTGVNVDYDIEDHYGKKRDVDEAVNTLVGAMEKTIGPNFLSTTPTRARSSDEQTSSSGTEEVNGGSFKGAATATKTTVERSESKESSQPSAEDDGTLVLPWTPSLGDDSGAGALGLEPSATQESGLSLSLTATVSAESNGGSSGDDDGSPKRVTYLKGSLTPMSMSFKSGPGVGAPESNFDDVTTTRSWDQ